ncbi:reverse transcriptase family protein [Mucilaginibacter sp.]
MTISAEQSFYITDAFERMETKEDFLDLLNYAKNIVFGANAYPIQLRQLNYYINGQDRKGNYTVFTIRKKSGSERTICAPNRGLKVIQTCLNLILQQLYKPDQVVHGFVSGSSIITNAQSHLCSRYVFNIDLKDFFSSIDQARIWGRLKLEPFNLNENSGRLHLANMISVLCCCEMKVKRLNEDSELERLKKRVLPQGAPTSPIIANIICDKLDKRLKGVAKRFEVKYSRYADDITFSSQHHIYNNNGDFFKEVRRVIQGQGFRLNEEKTRLQNEKFRQTVTGVVVNKKLNVDKRYVDKLRIWLHYWEKLGYDKAQPIILGFYLADKGYIKNPNANIRMVIMGKLNYLRMIKGPEDAVFRRLSDKFEYLSAIQPKEVKVKVPKPVTAQKSIKQVNFKSVVHDPRRLVTLLKNFSINDRALKYTTHNWDSGRDAAIFSNLSDFLESADKQYKAFSYELKNLSRNLNAKIFSFILNPEVNETGWGAHRIKFGWSSPELLEATSNDPALNPEDFVLPDKYQRRVEGNTIQKFIHVIDLFKNEIEIRDENSALRSLLLQKHSEHLISFIDPTTSNLDNKTFYTDVQWFGKALDIVFKNIQLRSQFNHVSYIVKDKLADRLILEITHTGSYNRGMSKDDEKLGLSKGSFGDMRKYLENLCDWSIESIFTEGAYRLNYLISDPRKPTQEQIIAPDGFKHIFTFYKSE